MRKNHKLIIHGNKQADSFGWGKNSCHGSMFHWQGNFRRASFLAKWSVAIGHWPPNRLADQLPIS